MGTWDKGLELGSIIPTLKEELGKAEGSEYTYLAVLLTQALNGCRVGEAFSAVQDFAKTGQRELRVRIEKRKDGAERLIIIPGDVAREKITPALKLANVKMYAKRRLHINTHSLRYAWITSQVKSNVNPGIIASITGHKNLNMLMRYIQKKEAEEYLRKQLQTAQGAY